MLYIYAVSIEDLIICDSKDNLIPVYIFLGDSPFFCQLDTCGITFKTSSDLKRHMKQHKQANLSPYSSFHGEFPMKSTIF